MKKLFILAFALFTMFACTGQNEPSNPNSNKGMLPGKFSVSSTKKVQFSQGNLQYQASTNVWRFADKQYDFVGESNLNISQTYDGWIDLFCWGTGNHPTFTCNEYEEYYKVPVFTDWGINRISNGGNTPNAWRTLTAKEWLYVISSRQNANMLYGFGNINGINGMIILPDNWQTPSGVSFTAIAAKDPDYDLGYRMSYQNRETDKYSHNVYSVDEWQKMEKAGAIFLPAAGHRGQDYVEDCNSMGSYYYSEPIVDPEFDDFYYYQLIFSNAGVWLFGDWLTNYGFSVRLAKDSE